MFGDGDLTLSALKLWSALEFSRVFLVFADVVATGLSPEGGGAVTGRDEGTDSI